MMRIIFNILKILLLFQIFTKMYHEDAFLQILISSIKERSICESWSISSCVDLKFRCLELKLIEGFVFLWK